MGLFGNKEEKLIKQQQKNKKLCEEGEKKYLKAQDLEAKGNTKKAKKLYKEASLSSPRVALEYAERLKKDENWEEYFNLCDDCHYLVSQRKEQGYFPFYKLTAECYFNGQGTTMNRPEAYDMMKGSLYHNDNEEDLETILFMLKCASGIVKDYRNKEYPDIAYLKRNDYAAVINEKKWTDIKKKLEQKAASLNHKDSIKAMADSNDKDASYKNMMKLANSGDYDAAANIFWKILPMSILPKDFDSINMLAVLKEGAENNNAECMFALSLLYLRNFVDSCLRFDAQAEKWRNPVAYDEGKFVYWLKKANDSGCKNIIAKVLLAQYYAVGKIWYNHSYNEDAIYEIKEKEIHPQKAYNILEKEITTEPEKLTYWYHVGHRLLVAMLFYGYGTDTNVSKARELMNTFGSKTSMWVTEEETKSLEALQKEFDKYR